MPNIVFIEPDGTRRDIAAEVGESAMEAARRNAVDNILAECGGSCICATCHVYVAPGCEHLLAPPEAIERDTLDQGRRRSPAKPVGFPDQTHAGP
jgi:2Fe-2S ferredoxin